MENSNKWSFVSDSRELESKTKRKKKPQPVTRQNESKEAQKKSGLSEKEIKEAKKAEENLKKSRRKKRQRTRCIEEKDPYEIDFHSNSTSSSILHSSSSTITTTTTTTTSPKGVVESSSSLAEKAFSSKSFQWSHWEKVKEIRRYFRRRKDHLTKPTAIQEATWPLCLEGRNLLVQAATGSGKTLAFLLPVVVMLNRAYGRKSKSALTKLQCPRALILCPTRELAQQVFADCEPLQSLFGFAAASVIGGVARQTELIRQTAILVATPGRLLDLATESPSLLQKIKIVVVDEADKMMDMGFGPQLESLFKLIPPPSPQIVLCSATLPPRVRNLVANSFLHSQLDQSSSSSSPSFSENSMHQDTFARLITVIEGKTTIETLDHAWLKKEKDKAQQYLESGEKQHVRAEDIVLTANIQQIVQVTAAHKKPAKLLRFIHKTRKEEGRHVLSPILIFVNQITSAGFVLDLLKRHTSESIGLLHGNMSQADRVSSLADFQSGRHSIMIATDVLGRGIHINHLPYIINYDFPPNLATYTHRIGRCSHQAQNALPGVAFSFFTRNLAPMAPDLIKILTTSSQSIDPFLRELAIAQE